MEVPSGSFELNRHLADLQLAIEIEHDCIATPLATMPVSVSVNRLSWRGMVGAFELHGHVFAQRCYAWPVMSQGKISFVTALKKPPVFSAEDAVRVWVRRCIGPGEQPAPAQARMGTAPAPVILRE
ncbi:MAG TPA: hypothetical protein VGC85_00710 [Chthoniobacterales bacterium]